MKAWLKQIDLETYRCEVIALPASTPSLTIGRTGADLIIKSERVSKKQCVLLNDGGRWLLEDLTSTGGTFVNGRRIHRHPLVHGDTLWLYDALLVFLESPQLRQAELEAAIDRDPDDAAAIHVLADWLLERGDAFGEHLLGKAAPEQVLEGLAPLVREGRLELVWRHGLLHTARVRCTNDATYSDVELVARLLSLRVARWLRELTIDLSTWVVPSANRIQQDAAAVLRGLAGGPALPCLERLSFGYFSESLPSTSFLPALFDRLAPRCPKLQTGARDLLRPVRTASLEVVHVPADLDFHAPAAHDGRIPLEAGVWVGASSPGQLRALAPGVPRSTSVQAFIVRQQSPQWCLIPLEEGVLLNGRPAVETRLLPGDVIEDRRGARFRFVTD
ncbi:MAG: FHA domain-containing protein [Myxococcaceae bacterium]